MSQTLAEVMLLVLDVDGVMTDGSVFLDASGAETKRFNVRDGLGIKLWRRCGFKAAFLTARQSLAVERRAKELDVEIVVQGVHDKSKGLDEILAHFGVGPERAAYMGDDWPDVPVLRRVGFAMAVQDAAEEVKAAAALVTRARGGRGAVREAIEHILERKGLLERARKDICGGG